MTRLIPNNADDHRGRFSKIITVAVAIAAALVLVLAGCSNPAQSDDGGGSSSDSGSGEAIPEQEAVEALIAVLQARNLVPQGIDSAQLADPSGPGPSAEDYVSTDIDSEGNPELTLYVDAEGDLVPSAEWRSANSNYCANENRYLKAPVKLIKIKTYGVSDGYYAFAQYIDIATGEIEEQREGEAAELQDAIDQAWGGIETPVGPASDPCGEEQHEYALVFETDTTLETWDADGVTTTFEETVTATVPLSYNYEQQFFEGNAQLTWTSFEAMTEAPDYTLNCSPPESGEINVIFRAGDEGTPPSQMSGSIEFFNFVGGGCEAPVDAAEQVFDALIPSFHTVWVALHMDEIDSSITYPPNPGRMVGYFTMENWAPVSGEEDVVAEKTYNRSSTEYENSLYEEHTTIRFTQ